MTLLDGAPGGDPADDRDSDTTGGRLRARLERVYVVTMSEAAADGAGVTVMGSVLGAVEGARDQLAAVGRPGRRAPSRTAGSVPDGGSVGVAPDGRCQTRAVTVMLRRARDDEAPALSELALRSKAWWGYDPDFLERVRPVLTIHPDMCSAGRVVVAVAGDTVVGFHQVEVGARGAWLTELFVAPEHIGTGVGRRLWADAVAVARGQGCPTLQLESDPHAEDFYARMGAVRVGEVESAPGRFLPVMRVDLS